MSLDEQLLDVLVCPETKEPLVYFEEENFLFSPRAKLKYDIEDDIPVMLVDEAEQVSDEEANELMETAKQRGLDNADQPIGTN